MNEPERDRRIDAAWRAASREEPPAEIDAALRAEARRAVGAAPGKKRNKHWWYPLASAAMVAALAVAIVQLTPPEQVSPTVVADMRVAPSAAPKEVAPPAALSEKQTAAPKEKPASATPPENAAAKPPSPSVDSTASAPSPQQDTVRRLQGAATGSVARQRAESSIAKEDDEKKQSYEGKRELSAQDKLASNKPDAAVTNAARSAPAATPPRDAFAAPPVASPAAPPASIAAVPASPANQAPPSVAASEPFPAKIAQESRRDLPIEERKAATELRSEQYAEQRKPAANATADRASRQEAGSATPSAQEAQIKSRVAMAKITASDEAKAKDASGRSVEEWIKRIRDLKREGRSDEAAKELAAFRTTYGERADALLPADLRGK